MEESKDCNVDIDIDILFRRTRKKRKIFGEGEYLFSGGKENQRKRGEIFGKDISRILRSLSFGFSLETFANFWRVSLSVLKSLVSEKSLGLGFGKFGLRKKADMEFVKNLHTQIFRLKVLHRKSA